MENQRQTVNWLRSAYIVAGVIFVTVLGGLVQILDIADHINYGLVKSLTSHPDGPNLNGHYLFPKNYLTIFIIFLSLMLIFPATTLLRYFTERDKQLKTEVIGLRQDLDDIVRYARNIIEYMYDVDVNVGRCDIKSAGLIHDIRENGDTYVEATYVIESNAEPSHFWCYWINADPESDAVTVFRDLKIDVMDMDRKRRLDWLPVENADKYKKIAIFYPELPAGESKTICISYFWPGFMRKLIDLSATNYDYIHASRTPDLRAPLHLEWIFADQIGTINGRITGRQSQSAELVSERRTRNTAWIYTDPEAPVNANCSVEFVKSK